MCKLINGPCCSYVIQSAVKFNNILYSNYSDFNIDGQIIIYGSIMASNVILTI